MKTWLQRTLAGLFGASVLVGGLTACGHRGYEHGAHARMSVEDIAKWRGKAIERATKELQLDGAQQARLGTLFDKLAEQRSALVGKTTDPRAELAALVAGDKFDRARASALIDEKTQALRGKSPEVIAAFGDFYDSLSAEQQQKVRAFMERGRHFGRRSGWHS